MESDAERLARLYREYGSRDMAVLGSPVYAAICAGLAIDPARGDLALAAPAGFRIPNIILAAVHHMLLSGIADPLGGYFPTLVGHRAKPVDAGLYPAFAAFVDRHRAELRRLIATHRTQTNEVGRSALLLPALGLAAGGAPLAMLEIGASAGLNLLLDRYRYRIGGRAVGDPSAAVAVICDVHGDLLPPVPDSPPAIAWRAGLDHSPRDIRDEASAAWLRAQVFPEHTDRMATLDAAIAEARRHPPPLVAGDAVDDLAGAATAAPAGAALTIVSTSVLVYLDGMRRLAFVEQVRRIAATHDGGAWLVACEPERVLRSLGIGLRGSGREPPELNTLALCHFRPDGHGQHRLLAVCQPHGRWMRWLDPDTARAA